jgi:predicted Zn-dependent protease
MTPSASDADIGLFFSFAARHSERYGSFQVSQRAPNVDRLYSDIEWALAHGLPPRELVPMLEKLLRHAPGHSPHAVFAKRQLAELIAQRDPWRTARLARDVLAVLPEDDRAWAALGLAHTLLGNYRSAERAYREALMLAPCSPWYAHNLGHLIDIGLDRPRDALRYLAAAHRGLPQEPEIAGSYAHALARADRWEEAVPLLARAIGRDARAAEAMLADWLSRSPLGSLPETRSPGEPEQ